MLKVFLVEDEIVIREGIKNNINWQQENLEFVGEASDGELAFPMIQRLKPDILITDIKMPFMNGLELSKLVKQELPHIKIIILSGYNEFDYAKEAITIGITEYLLKPISAIKLLDSVREVAKKIENENEKKKYGIQFAREQLEQEYFEKQNFLNELMSNKLSISDIIEKGRMLNIELTAQKYNVILFKVTKKNEKNTNYSDEMVQITKEIQQIIEKHFPRKMYMFDRGSEGWIFIVEGETIEDIKEIQNLAFKELRSLIDKHQDIEYFGGIGKIVQRLRELSESFDEANKAFSYRYLTDVNQIVYSDKINEYNNLLEDNLDLKTLDIGKIDRNILVNFLKSGLKEEIKHFIEDYFASLGKKNTDSLLFRQYITMDMYFSTIAFIEDMGQNTDYMKKTFGDLKGVTAVLSTIDNAKAYLYMVIEEAITIRDSISMKKYGGMLDNAKEYIEKNYDSENISLNSVAASVNISPSYFSMIFSQEVGKTFIEFLTEVRMEKAKELLMCSGMKSSEIGYAVGYKDSHYFSYLFKKTQECTPKEFRMRGK